MQLSNDSDAMYNGWVHYLYYSYIFCAVHLLTYLHSWLGAYKTGNISETVEDRAKVTINNLFKVVPGLSIAAITYDLE